MGGMFAILSVLSREFWATQAKRKVVEINTKEWNQFPLLRNDSSKIIALALTLMWYVIGVYILLFGNVDDIILRNEDW